MDIPSGKEKVCFVIMPISDPQLKTQAYEPGHFTAVYRHIIQPACKQAGFEPIRADEVNQTNYIALDVLRRLSSAEMAVCDISARNPNVLYELGIRHALKKPVTLIKDNVTERIFDIDGLRRIEYDVSLRIDRIFEIVSDLADAIRETYDARLSDDSSLMHLIEAAASPASETIPGNEESGVGPETDVQYSTSRDQTQLAGVVDNWNESKGFGFIRTDDESFYFGRDHLAQESVPEAGRTAFFVPATANIRGGHRVASCTFCVYSEVRATIDYANTNRGFGFAQVEDSNGNAQQIYVPLNSLVGSPKEGDTVYLAIRRNDLGPIGVGIQDSDDDSSPVEPAIDVRVASESVRCPECDEFVNVTLGVASGASAIGSCAQCENRFHVHRRSSGESFTKNWGAGRVRVVATCPECDSRVPLNFTPRNLVEKRFCMGCNSELSINPEGEVLESNQSTPVTALGTTFAANRWHLKCPHCQTPVPSFWWSDSLHKAVCKPCHVLMEAICDDVGAQGPVGSEPEDNLPTPSSS